MQRGGRAAELWYLYPRPYAGGDLHLRRCAGLLEFEALHNGAPAYLCIFQTSTYNGKIPKIDAHKGGKRRGFLTCAAFLRIRACAAGAATQFAARPGNAY